MKTLNLSRFKSHRWILASFLVGITASLTSALFIFTLNAITTFRTHHPMFIWGLPVAGFFIGWIYHLHGNEASQGNNLVLLEMHSPKNKLPLKIVPVVYIGTLLSQLVGASTGREGVIVQVTSTLSDKIGSYFHFDKLERSMILMAGAGAGFGAAINAPFAGIIFGMEVLYIGKFHLKAWPQCIVASISAYFFSLIFKIPHSHFPSVNLPAFSIGLIPSLIIAGILFGLTALIFSFGTRFINRVAKKYIKRPYLIPMFGGLLIALLYKAEGSYRYTGLGIPLIKQSLEAMTSFRDPFFKALFSMFSLGTGFKGGEFVPLVFIGTTLGNSLSAFLPVSLSLLATLGFGAVFAGAANVPFACTIMLCEIFGWKIFLYALITCYSSYYFSGHTGIYHTQQIFQRKHHRIRKLLKF